MFLLHIWCTKFLKSSKNSDDLSIGFHGDFRTRKQKLTENKKTKGNVKNLIENKRKYF